MDGFERRKQIKKKAIIDAGLQLFQVNGIKNVSINEIAKQANVSQVTIYNYFTSKENLLYEVLIRFTEDYWKEYKSLLQSDVHFTDKLKATLFDKTKAANDIHPEFYTYFLEEYGKEGGYIANLYQNEILPLIMDFFNQGRETGVINPKLSNEAIFFYMQMFIEYMQRDDIISHALPMTEELTLIFFYGIVGNEH